MHHMSKYSVPQSMSHNGYQIRVSQELMKVSYDLILRLGRGSRRMALLSYKCAFKILENSGCGLIKLGPRLTKGRLWFTLGDPTHTLSNKSRDWNF